MANGSELKARKLRVDMVRRNIEEFNPKSVYISNINLNTTEMELGKFFEKYGDVKTVKLLDPKMTSLCAQDTLTSAIHRVWRWPSKLTAFSSKEKTSQSKEPS